MEDYILMRNENVFQIAQRGSYMYIFIDYSLSLVTRHHLLFHLRELAPLRYNKYQEIQKHVDRFKVDIAFTCMCYTN